MALEHVRLYLLADDLSSRPQSPPLSPEPETSEMTEKPSAESSDSPPAGARLPKFRTDGNRGRGLGRRGWSGRRRDAGEFSGLLGVRVAPHGPAAVLLRRLGMRDAKLGCRSSPFSKYEALF
ncbi:hypothetical protein E4U14_004163 [Claviceps sp. LM454 group G7]|nr:hypothetical protein E4U14_004163 [Claviceps sp. LM454 group G7]